MTTQTETIMTVEEARKVFDEEVRRAYAVFTPLQRKKEFRDLSPRFWVAWLDLKKAVDDAVSNEVLRQEFTKAYKQFGSPGDFGYGEPTGKALKHLYVAWGDLANALANQPDTAA